MIKNGWIQEVLQQLREGGDETTVFSQPAILSVSANSFYHHLHGTLGVLLVSTDAAIFADNAAYVAKKIIQNELPYPREFDPHRPLSDQPGPHLRRLKLTQQPLMEMILIRLADNFTNYLSDVTAERLKARPSLLKSSKDQLTTDAILSYSTLGELQQFLIERKLISLAYLGLSKQLDWMSQRLGIADLKMQPCFPSLIQLIETRNCMVHNRGKIGVKYIEALSPHGVSANVGESLKPTFDDLFVAAKASEELARFLDAYLVNKFDLPADASV